MKPVNVPPGTDTEHEYANEEGATISKAGLALAVGCFLAAMIWSLAAEACSRLRSWTIQSVKDDFEICSKHNKPTTKDPHE